MAFRILGIKILEGCKPEVHKILKIGKSYLLCNDYSESPKNENTLVKLQERTKTEKELYYVACENKRPLEVTVSGVVGKNGDGKSSFVEIMLRILNNAAYAFGFLTDQSSLLYNSAVAGILYFEVDDNIYAIRCEAAVVPISADGHSNITIWRNGTEITHINLQDSDADKKKKFKECKLFEKFYTLVINYSLYSYNSLTMLNEAKGPDSWIDALFHKNDSYQTPVVLNPMREEGIINVNREAQLSYQRLLSLYTLAGKKSEERKVSDVDEAIGFVFQQETESKFINKTIGEYFGWNHRQDYRWANFDLYYMPLIEGKEDKYKNDRIDTFKKFITFWMDFQDLYRKNNQLMAIVEDILLKKEFGRSADSDFNKYVSKMLAEMEIHQYAPMFPCRDSIMNFLNEALVTINFAEFYRLVLVMVLWEKLKKKCKEIDCGLNVAIVHRNEPLYAAKLYVLYKILAIITTYTPYKSSKYIEDTTYDLFATSIADNVGFDLLDKDVDEILGKTDYTTLKLRQALNYIRHYSDDNKYYKAMPVAEALPDYKGSLVNKLYVSFESLYAQISSYDDYAGIQSIMSLLPPPIFRGDIVIQDSTSSYDMDLMSSGEKQRLNSVGSFLYHLRNLDAKQTDERKMQYENIFVIFEEVELYFHPEYQKSYVKYLLNQLRMMQMENIKSINILYVTHSPFILSDIVRSNVLYLERGDVNNERKIETFGANLYDLTYDGFFLRENALGDYSSEYIRKIIGRANRNESVKEEELKLIGDELIRNYVEQKTTIC